jgi:hypothetical protein
MKIDIEKQTKEWKERFKNMSDTELLKTYEKQRKNSGWVSIKGLYLSLSKE